MRTIVSVLGTLEPENEKRDAQEIAIRLTAVLGPALLYWYHFTKFDMRIKAYTGPNDTVAQNFMKHLFYWKMSDLTPKMNYMLSTS